MSDEELMALIASGKTTQLGDYGAQLQDLRRRGLIRYVRKNQGGNGWELVKR